MRREEDPRASLRLPVSDAATASQCLLPQADLGVGENTTSAQARSSNGPHAGGSTPPGLRVAETPTRASASPAFSPSTTNTIFRRPGLNDLGQAVEDATRIAQGVDPSWLPSGRAGEGPRLQASTWNSRLPSSSEPRRSWPRLRRGPYSPTRQPSFCRTKSLQTMRSSPANCARETRLARRPQT